MLILLKKYVPTNCFQMVSKCYMFFCINFYIMFVTFYIFIPCQINIII